MSWSLDGKRSFLTPSPICGGWGFPSAIPEIVEGHYVSPFREFHHSVKLLLPCELPLRLRRVEPGLPTTVCRPTSCSGASFTYLGCDRTRRTAQTLLFKTQGRPPAAISRYA